MRRSTLHALAAVTLATAFANVIAAPLAKRLPGPSFPSFASAPALQADCDLQLAAARARVHRLETRKVDGGWLGALDDLNAAISDGSYPIHLISSVHPSKPMRDAAQACLLGWQDFSSSLGQNERLYRALREAPAADATDAEFKRTQLLDFEDSGVGLPPAARERVKQIADRSAKLSLDFGAELRDQKTRLAFTTAELKGVPEHVWQKAPRDAEGRVLLGLDYPSSVPVLSYAEDASVRERMYRAKQNEGGDANLQRLDELVALRKELATLFGYGSYADFTLRRQMAHDLQQAERFLGGVQAAVGQRELTDLAQLRDAKAAHTGQADAKLQRWDVSFYQERVRRAKYDVDQEAFRAYLPPQQSLHFVMRVVERMFGLRYTRVPAKVWHPEVQAYAVSDAASGRPIATLYVDLYPRDGKYNHAAVWSYRAGSTRSGALPEAALVVNFDRRGLTLGELETLLHEFGHSVHSNLSRTRHASQAGTSVERDFVEAPSQMLEEWVYDPRVLALMKEVCAACKPVPDAMIARADEARHFGKGLFVSRQQLFASYDLALHGPKAPPPMATWVAMESATPLGHVAGTRFPAGFGHIAGGYAAGYYGYLWSLVVALDMATAFDGHRLDPAIGQRYRDSVLANGGQRPPRELVREFLGRDFNADAFNRYLAR